MYIRLSRTILLYLENQKQTAYAVLPTLAKREGRVSNRSLKPMLLLTKELEHQYDKIDPHALKELHGNCWQKENESPMERTTCTGLSGKCRCQFIDSAGQKSPQGGR